MHRVPFVGCHRMVDVTTGWDPKGNCQDGTPSMILGPTLLFTCLVQVKDNLHCIPPYLLTWLNIFCILLMCDLLIIYFENIVIRN